MDMRTNHSDYRLILKEELDNRCGQNPHYSLRAFARDLAVAPSRLSEILNYKQGLSRKAATKIAEQIGMRFDEKEYFLDLVTAAHARSPKDRRTAQVRLLKYKQENDAIFQLKTDTFKIISDWYHLAILELINLEGFRDDCRWIARQLRITAVQAELAIERLLRVKLLERKDGELMATTNTGWIQSEVPSESIRKFHRQILTRAQEALTQHIHKREFNTDIITINRKDIPEAKDAIRRFRQKFSSDLQKSGVFDDLYCLSLQFFSLIERGEV